MAGPLTLGGRPIHGNHAIASKYVGNPVSNGAGHLLEIVV